MRELHVGDHCDGHHVDLISHGASKSIVTILLQCGSCSKKNASNQFGSMYGSQVVNSFGVGGHFGSPIPLRCLSAPGFRRAVKFWFLRVQVRLTQDLFWAIPHRALPGALLYRAVPEALLYRAQIR